MRLQQWPMRLGRISGSAPRRASIFLCYTCNMCEREKLSHYRPDIFRPTSATSRSTRTRTACPAGSAGLISAIMKRMDEGEYREKIDALGLTQIGAAEFLDIGERTSRRYAS